MATKKNENTVMHLGIASWSVSEEVKGIAKPVTTAQFWATAVETDDGGALVILDSVPSTNFTSNTRVQWLALKETLRGLRCEKPDTTLRVYLDNKFTAEQYDGSNSASLLFGDDASSSRIPNADLRSACHSAAKDYAGVYVKWQFTSPTVMLAKQHCIAACEGSMSRGRYTFSKAEYAAFKKQHITDTDARVRQAAQA